MDKLLQRIKTSDLDKYTIAEIKMLIERKLDEQAKFRGQIARDLRRIGDYAFQDPSAYRKHGGCPACLSNRLHSTNKRKQAADNQFKEANHNEIYQDC